MSNTTTYDNRVETIYNVAHEMGWTEKDTVQVLVSYIDALEKSSFAGSIEDYLANLIEQCSFEEEVAVEPELVEFPPDQAADHDFIELDATYDGAVVKLVLQPRDLDKWTDANVTLASPSVIGQANRTETLGSVLMELSHYRTGIPGEYDSVRFHFPVCVGEHANYIDAYISKHGEMIDGHAVTTSFVEREYRFLDAEAEITFYVQIVNPTLDNY